MDFDEAYAELIEFHVNRRTGLARERVLKGVGHAEHRFLETVWWPCFHQFDSLHPEYEIRDFSDVNRYIDFAFVQKHYRIAIEIDGFVPHYKEATPEQFSTERLRQDHLVIDEWHVLRFSYQTVELHPRKCQQIVQQLLGRLTGSLHRELDALGPVDRAIVFFAIERDGKITVADAAMRLHVSPHTAIRHLQQLATIGWLQPIGSPKRTRAYQLHPVREHLQL